LTYSPVLFFSPLNHFPSFFNLIFFWFEIFIPSPKKQWFDDVLAPSTGLLPFLSPTWQEFGTRLRLRVPDIAQELENNVYI